jgi:hypothetical protein
MALDKVLVGADPEIFIRRRDNGAFVSAGGLIPGTKNDPWPVEKGAIQVDGVALEFNINPSATTEEFITNLVSVMGDLSERALGYRHDCEKHNHPNSTLEFAIVPVARFEKNYFATLPSSDLALGCDPDYDAYSGKQNPKPDTAEPMRTASGHLHIGWTTGQKLFSDHHFELCRRLVKQLDVALFIPSLMWDEDDSRRDLYGQPGSFRPKHYGLEYRVLSNAWLRDLDIARWVYEQLVWACREFAKGNFLFDKYKLSEMPETIVLDTHGMGGPQFPWHSPLYERVTGNTKKFANSTLEVNCGC